MSMLWNPRARELFQDLVRKGPPEAFRDQASAAIEEEAERGARARGAPKVDVGDVARACLRVAPPAFRPRVMKNLESHGVDPALYAPKDASKGPAEKEGAFDSEWDRVHARIVSHREEVARIYGMNRGDGPLRVLDMACGTGKHLLEFARDGHRCHGNDQQEWKIAKAAEQAREKGYSISFTSGDLRALELPEKFDLVVCLYAMSTLPTEDDALAALRTAARHLAPGGVFVFNVINKAANTDPLAPMYRSVHVEKHLRDYTRAEIEALLRRAGLALRTAEPSPLLGVPDLDFFAAATAMSTTGGSNDGR